MFSEDIFLFFWQSPEHNEERDWLNDPGYIFYAFTRINASCFWIFILPSENLSITIHIFIVCNAEIQRYLFSKCIYMSSILYKYNLSTMELLALCVIYQNHMYDHHEQMCKLFDVFFLFSSHLETPRTSRIIL